MPSAFSIIRSSTAYRLCILLLSLAACLPAQAIRQVNIIDPFFGNMPAVSIQVPDNWRVSGTVLRGAGCGTEDPQIVFRAESPDGLTGVQLLPRTIWFNADAQTLQMYGRGNCTQLGEVSPVDLGVRFLATRPPATVVSSGPFDDPVFNHNMELANGTMRSYAVSRGYTPAELTGVEGRLLLHYSMNGKAEEETLMVQEQKMTMRVGVMGTQTRLVYHPLTQITATIVGLRAPSGRLASAESQLLQILRSQQANPEWTQAQQAYFQRQQDAFKRAGAAMLERNRAFMDHQTQLFRAQSDALNARTNQNRADTLRAQDQLQRQGQDQIDFLAGNQYYRDPGTGQHVTLPAYDGRSYMRTDGSNSGGTVVRSNDAFFDPNRSLPGNWTQLEPVPH